ncbi:DNA repair protein RecN [Anaerolentibacter hominis]|uniref:DNA repair protein RecN n=1 Tax=Anaerolentibacter hominis TaxID=3079009 RepID=UPI0031B7ED58
MLLNLHVKNLAIIEEAEIDFSDHLNILTGETGAGKSVIIGSVNLALGGKISKEMIRRGADYALAELLFSVEDERTLKGLKKLDIPMEDGQLLISRRIYSGRAVNKINGETVTLSLLKQAAALLIDIHGQHEHQSLLRKEKHLEIVDRYAKDDTVREEVKHCFQICAELRRKSREAAVPEEQRAREISFLEYEKNEIESARLKPGEEEELTAQYRRLSNAHLIEEGIGTVYRMTGGEDGTASDQIGRSVRSLSQLTEYDEPIGGLCSQLEEIEELLADFNRNLSDYQMGLEFDPEQLSEAEERLDLIHRLQSKYGNTHEEIMEYYDSVCAKLEQYDNYDSYLRDMEKQLKAAEEAYAAAAGKLSEQRKKAGVILQDKIKEVLTDLNFLDVRFEIAIREKAGTADGTDDVEFLISTNPGEPVQSLGMVASGGELSRIMLAIKSILAAQDEIGTLIFDEIDTGISGVTAQKVAEKLALIAAGHQVICITHLQQIAAMADVHYLIRKSSESSSTQVMTTRLSEEESIRELGRMLGGTNVTESVLLSARELKESAGQFKHYE